MIPIIANLSKVITFWKSILNNVNVKKGPEKWIKYGINPMSLKLDINLAFGSEIRWPLPKRKAPKSLVINLNDSDRKTSRNPKPV